MARKLVVLNYNLKPDVDLAAYDDYIRSKDYPAFRARPCIQEYNIYSFVKTPQGKPAFSHFDLMFVEDFDDFARDVLGDPAVARHADDWITRWGIHGGDEPHDSGRNYQVFFAEEIWG